MFNKIMKSQKNDEGISPVIGVILMVAITVLMAAVVSTWSNGVKSPATPPSVGLDITRTSTHVSIVVASIDPITAAPLPSINVSYQYWDNTLSTFRTTTDSKANLNVGDLIEIDTNNPSPKRIIITATYKDNSKKVLYSQEV